MVNTYSQIYIQIVFAVEGRQNLIDPIRNDELQKYITGLVTAQNQKLIVINNMPDHVHLLIGQRPDSVLQTLSVISNPAQQISLIDIVGSKEDSTGRRVLGPSPILVRSWTR